MSNSEKRNIRPELIDNFPRLTDKGKQACLKHIKENGMIDFCLSGFARLEQDDQLLFEAVGRLKEFFKERNPDFQNAADNSITYSVGFLYQTLSLNCNETGEELPRMTKERLKLYTKEFTDCQYHYGDATLDSLGDFLSLFDVKLAEVVGGFLDYENPLWQAKSLNRMIGYHAIYTTYNALLFQQMNDEFVQKWSKTN